MATTPDSLIDTVYNLIGNDVGVRQWCRTVTRQEFPYTTTTDPTTGDAAYPAVHVNVDGVNDEAGEPSILTVARTLTFAVYISMGEAELSALENNLWKRIEQVRTLLRENRTLNDALYLPILNFDITPVVIPGMGVNYVGARKISFEAKFKEAFE